MSIQWQSPALQRNLRWAARISGLLLLAFFAAMQAAPDPVAGGFVFEPFAWRRAVIPVLFPGLFVVGYLVAWWRPAIGGGVMIAAYPLFAVYVQWLYGRVGEHLWATVLLALMFAVPGALFVLLGSTAPRENAGFEPPRDVHPHGAT